MHARHSPPKATTSLLLEDTLRIIFPVQLLNKFHASQIPSISSQPCGDLLYGARGGSRTARASGLFTAWFLFLPSTTSDVTGMVLEAKEPWHLNSQLTY